MPIPASPAVNRSFSKSTPNASDNAAMTIALPPNANASDPFNIADNAITFNTP